MVILSFCSFDVKGVGSRENAKGDFCAPGGTLSFVCDASEDGNEDENAKELGIGEDESTVPPIFSGANKDEKVLVESDGWKRLGLEQLSGTPCCVAAGSLSGIGCESSSKDLSRLEGDVDVSISGIPFCWGGRTSGSLSSPLTKRASSSVDVPSSRVDKG